MPARNALVPLSARRQGGQMSLAMLFRILETMGNIRESQWRRRARLAEIEAQTTEQIGARRGQTIRQIGQAGAQTRTNIGTIGAQSVATQSNIRTNMLNRLLGEGGTLGTLIETPGVLSRTRTPARGVGGAGFPVSGGNVLGPRVTP